MDSNLYTKISHRIIYSDNSLLSAIKQMDSEHVKLLFVFTDDVFLGILTIGDIQRAIIANISLNDKISTIIDKDKKYASLSDSVDKIKADVFALRAECMPVLDAEKRLVNVYFWNDFFGEQAIERREKINLPVVIMAGGLGTRLKPLTNVIPKPLIPIGEKTILETILDQFESIGCSKFFMSVNYKSEFIKYYLANVEHKYDLEYFKEDKPLGTIGSVSLLKGKINSPFFVSNCDIIIDQDFRDVYNYHCQNKNDMTIVSAVKSYQIPYGVIETSKNGLMVNLSEKPEMTYMINTGVYILQSELISEIPTDDFYHITDLMTKVKARGGRVGCFPVSEKSWTDLGDLDEYVKLIR